MFKKITHAGNRLFKITGIALFTSISIFVTSCKKDKPFDEALVKKITIQSAYTGSVYPVYIVLPENYDPGKKYETLYTLDGDDELGGIKVYEQLGWACKKASINYSKQNVIVVAIGSLGSHERFRDYSPVPNKEEPIGVGGGSENYSKFIKLELIPMVQQNYSVDTSAQKRILSGHSLGGTFAGFMFTMHPEVFSNYLILSPAFWWGDGTILEYEELTRQANSNRKNIIYTGCGELEEGIRILAKEWNFRIKTYYQNCISDFHVVNTAGHLSSARENINNSISFYFTNK